MYCMIFNSNFSNPSDRLLQVIPNILRHKFLQYPKQEIWSLWPLYINKPNQINKLACDQLVDENLKFYLSLLIFVYKNQLS